MPAFSPIYIRPYFDEVQYQVEAFMGVARETPPLGSEGRTHDELSRRISAVFRNAQAMVTAAAQLSKLFWVPNPSKERSERESEKLEFGLARSEYLRRIFQVDNRSPLKKRDVRNAYEHLDDRLDSILSKGQLPPIMDRSIGSLTAYSFSTPPLVKRFLDPDEQILTVMNTRLHMPPLVQEVERLERLIISMTLNRFDPTDALSSEVR